MTAAKGAGNKTASSIGSCPESTLEAEREGRWGDLSRCSGYVRCRTRRERDSSVGRRVFFRIVGSDPDLGLHRGNIPIHGLSRRFADIFAAFRRYKCIRCRCVALTPRSGRALSGIQAAGRACSSSCCRAKAAHPISAGGRSGPKAASRFCKAGRF